MWPFKTKKEIIECYCDKLPKTIYYNYGTEEKPLSIKNCPLCNIKPTFTCERGSYNDSHFRIEIRCETCSVKKYLYGKKEEKFTPVYFKTCWDYIITEWNSLGVIPLSLPKEIPE